MKFTQNILGIFISVFLTYGCVQHSSVPIQTIHENEASQKTNIIGNTTHQSMPQEKVCIKNPEISVFMYHYIRDDDPKDSHTIRNLSVTPENFESHMKIVSSLYQNNNFSLMKGADFVESFRNNCFPHKKIWIFTSDDGWIDTATNLSPIAEKYNIPFIFGIITSKIGTKNFVSHQDVINLSRNPLFTIASHTINHQEHTRLSDSQEKQEICDSKKELEKITQSPIDFFIYPVGKIGKSSEKYLKECGYTLAWSTHFGKKFDWNNPKPFIINRIRIHHNTGTKFFENQLK